MRQLSEQEIEVLQRMIVNEGWMPIIPEYIRKNSCTSTYEIDDIKYLIYKDDIDVEGWEIE